MVVYRILYYEMSASVTEYIAPETWRSLVIIAYDLSIGTLDVALDVVCVHFFDMIVFPSS